MPIPQAPELGEVGSPQVNVKLDASALNAPNRARMQRADAMQGLSATVFDMGQKMQEAKNTADLIDAQGKLARTRQAFIEQLQTNQDPSTWHKDWQDTVKQTQDNLIGKESRLAPEVRQRLALDIKDWGDTTGISVRGLAVKRTNQDGAIKIQTAVDEYAKDGNFKAASAAIDAGTKAGFWVPADGDAQKNQVEQKIDFYSAKNYIDNHPTGAVEYLSDKTPTGRYRNLTNLNPTQRDALITAARRKANDSQADYLSSLTGNYDANPENAMTRPQLDDLVKAGRISQKGADGYLRLVEKTNLKTARDDAAQLHQDVYEMDFSVEKNPEQKAREMKDEAAGLPMQLRKPIVELIDNKLQAAKKGLARDENPVEKQTFDAMREDREASGVFVPLVSTTTKAPWYEFWKSDKTSTAEFAGGMSAFRKQLNTMSADEIKDHFGPDATAKKVLDAEQLQYARKTEKMRDWFKANPKATVDQADEYRQSLEAPYVMEAVKQSLAAGPSINQPGEPDTSKEDYDKLKAGDTFYWQGKQLTKQ